MNEIKCPFCKSSRLWKAGVTYDKVGKNQRYVCRDCHKYTVKPIIDVVINTTS